MASKGHIPGVKKPAGKNNMYIDLLIKIKNAQAAGKPILKVTATKADKAVADVLSSAAS